ncbi:MAG: TonB family protein, partial [Desulfobacteraceae bacterium]
DSIMGNRKKRTHYVIAGIAVGLVILMGASAVAVIKLLLQDDSQRRKRRIQMITVVKPPPPPKIKEKPPEPEVKKEEIVEPEPEETPPEPTDDASQDDTPPGEDLGLDTDGTAGSDTFGLRAKKGGRALIGGDYGSATLMRRYAWYTRIIQDELRKRMNHHMEEHGGIPDGNPKVMVQIKLDDLGKVVVFNIARPSGDRRMDDAVLNALKLVTISEPPPKGMPRVIQLKISAKGYSND